MFNIFNKKKFLIDYLKNLVDIHNHILPGIDDGAKTVDESIQLIKEFSEFGVTNFIATPHVMDNYYPNTPETIHEAFTALKNELKQHKDLSKTYLDYAAEHMIDANFDLILNESKILPLRKKYLLVEMSYLQPSINFNNAINNIGSKNLFPILAHPERYGYLHNSSKYATYKKNGIMFQLNLLSLGEYYGKETNKCALKLLDKGMYDFVGSDIHNMRQLNALKGIKITTKIADQIEPIIEKNIYNFY
ncbi:histidinol phosphatase [Cellulophaga baltica]|uniref:tyrosine-protein phosphatase n=1 Tax=Cellulophaga TaxID=104264 RepID=UPI001C06B1E2|nr:MULTISPECIES: CpsB/CapC family capsule biosynthesis tyrosine phosphatase [Cellulophaga]MBU2996756.1 histidinol phosphatase [Cellulophaga baltica]MDO6768152.1 histidinol phosphatase [Cellulophaga sp. 1_MG-2023]